MRRGTCANTPTKATRFAAALTLAAWLDPSPAAARVAAPESREADAPAASEASAPPESTADEVSEPAPSPTAEEQAVEAFQKGRDAYAAAEYQVALEHFQDAQGLHPSPDFHYNIGQCYESLDNLEQAINSYRAYLRSDPADRNNVETKIKKLEQRREEQRRLAEQARADADKRSAPPAPDRSKPLIVGGAVLLAVGAGAAGGLGAAFGARASDRSERIDAVNSGNPDDLTLAQARALDEEGRRAEVMQMVAIGAGGAVALTGIALLAAGIAKKRDHARGTRAAAARLAPALAPTGFALSLAGEF